MECALQVTLRPEACPPQIAEPHCVKDEQTIVGPSSDSERPTKAPTSRDITPATKITVSCEQAGMKCSNAQGCAQGLPAPVPNVRRKATEPGHYSLGKAVTLLAVALMFFMAGILVRFNNTRHIVINLSINQRAAVDSTDGAPAAVVGRHDGAQIVNATTVTRFRVKP